MKILIDMNLSPMWVSVLKEAGYTAIHWSIIGAPNAPDVIGNLVPLKTSIALKSGKSRRQWLME